MKAVNITMGESGLVPSLFLVFGVIPRFPILIPDMLNRRNNMRILSEVHMEMSTMQKGDSLLHYREDFQVLLSGTMRKMKSY